MKRLILMLLLLCSVCACFQTQAQTAYNVPSSGSQTITVCDAIIRDPGGNNNYGNNCSGYLVIQPQTSSCVVHLSGSYSTESSFDKIYIYNGVGTTGTVLLDGVSGTGTVNVSSTTGALTVKFTSDGSVTRTGFEFQTSCVGGCSCGGSPINISYSFQPDGILMSWSQSLDPSVTSYFVEYGQAGFTPGSGTRVLVNATSYLLQNLNPGETYDVYLYYDCGNDGLLTTESYTFSQCCMPLDASCIDMTDLNSPDITCYYGSFSNPYQNVGVVDDGPQSSSSRHTIHDIDELDPRTNNSLHVLPPCELYSVRLGNWSTGSQAESITYNFHVDTTQAAILLLKYAAVLEDPNHSPSDQPRFKFELLDQNNHVVDPTCGAADFIANSNLGWNSGVTGVLWKDWTNVGTDLSNYHGQTIRIRLTTFDCDQGAHYGYAYFNLNCKKKVITVETCGEVSQNTYTAPSGFAYRWYYQTAPNTIISTNQSVSVGMQQQTGTLCCRVMSLNNEDCFFTLSASLSPRYPLARFEAHRDSCSFIYHFENTSVISADGITPSATGEPCETSHWDFGDGTQSEDMNPVHEFPGPGNYTVRLVSGINQDACQDTAYYLVNLVSNQPQIIGDFVLCSGENSTLQAMGGYIYSWSVGTDTIGHGETIVVEPDETTTYTLYSFAEDGCVVDVEQEVVVFPTSSNDLEDSVCQGESYNEYGFNLPVQTATGTFIYERLLQNTNGCDSTVTLSLNVIPLPHVDLGENMEHCFNMDGPVELFVAEDDCDSYLWDDGQTSRSIIVESEGTYSVIALKNGCGRADEITIKDVCPLILYFPNTITAGNKDGLNDYFQLSNYNNVSEFSIHIYSRNGELVYSSNDPQFTWDGSYRGKILCNVVYNYVVFCTDKNGLPYMFKGCITVL